MKAMTYRTGLDVIENRMTALISGKPDRMISELGLRAEVGRKGRHSRLGRGRTDVKHMWMDPVIVAGPWLMLAAVVIRLVRRRR